MKIITIIILFLVLVGLSIEIYFIFRDNNQLSAELNNLNLRLEALMDENKKLQSDIEYFSYPENLEKELRLKFNYKKPGEEMIIVVP
ncbi:septum formation initiator family protein [Candidatus Wolfebacteria bacterium]|nr:septum formation initiator family protein [Candidatus Wolfebacteria bacterium]